MWSRYPAALVASRDLIRRGYFSEEIGAGGDHHGPAAMPHEH